MIDLGNIRDDSPLLDDTTKGTLKNIFSKLNREIGLKAVVDMEEEKSAEMASFLKGLAMLDEKVRLELYAPSEAEGLGLDTAYLPVTGMYLDGVYQRVAFHGVPGGKEINSFVIAMYNLAGPGQEIAPATVRKIGKLKKPVQVQIFTSLSCHHCPGVVIACQRIAILSEVVEARMYDANLYPELVEKYHIERVPMIVLNGKEIYTGPRSIEDLVQLLKDVKGLSE